LLFLPVACSSLRNKGEPPLPDEADALCPSEIQDQIKVFASASKSLDSSAPEQFARMLVGRKVLISLAPGPTAMRLHVLSSTLTLTSIGGTFEGMLRSSDGDTRAIDIIPGRVRIAPFIASNTLRPQTISLDLSIVPGGAATDEMVI